MEALLSSRDFALLSRELAAQPREFPFLSLLRDAITGDNIQLVLALIENGVNINTRYEDGTRPF